MSPRRIQRLAFAALAIFLTWPQTIQADQAPTRLAMSAGGTDVAVVVPLDDTGIADWAFLNPRNPASLTTSAGTATVVRFENQTLDRTIQVEISFPVVNRNDLARIYRDSPLLEQWEKEQRGNDAPIPSNPLEKLNKAGVLESCTEDGERCTLKISVDPNLPREVQTAVIAPEGSDEVTVLKVNFFDVVDTPTNQVGYMRRTAGASDVRITPLEPVNVVGAISGVVDPLVAAELPDPADPTKTVRKSMIDSDHPYDGTQGNHMVASGKVELAYAMGTRADGRLTLVFKDGDLGTAEDDKANKLSATSYLFNVYALSGLALRYGKTVFAQPSNRIAVREAGEGFQLGVQRFSLTHIVKRESVDFIVDADNEDHRVWIGQMINAPFGQNPFFRRYSLLALYGEDDEPNKERTYTTYGGELFFGSIAADLGGSLAAYLSRNNSKNPALLSKGEGGVALLTITKALGKTMGQDGRERIRRSLTLLAGAGTGDDPSTAENESYIGETAGFSGDSIFLSRLARPLLEGGVPNVLPGLANKRYLGLQLNDNGFSLLAWIGRHLLQIPDQDIKARSTKLSLHDYRFREAVQGSADAGREIDLEFLVESPQGVRVTLGGGYFFPGDALKGLVLEDTWSVTAKVSIEPR